VDSADAKAHQRIGMLLTRVLIVDPLPASIKLISELLRDVGHCQIWAAAAASHALAVASRIDPHLVVVEHCEGLNGVAFARDLRRSDLSCRKAPVIMISAEATASVILGARDAGVHEFLRKPFTIKDLVRRLEAVALKPRDWVEGIGYVGPDRRRFNSGDYAGPLKRRVDHAVTPDEARIVQALKILKSAMFAIESDPAQALRAMRAQACDLATAAKAVGDTELRAEAVALGERLESLDPLVLKVARLDTLIAPLVARLPQGEAAGRKSAA